MPSGGVRHPLPHAYVDFECTGGLGTISALVPIGLYLAGLVATEIQTLTHSLDYVVTGDWIEHCVRISAPSWSFGQSPEHYQARVLLQMHWFHNCKQIFPFPVTVFNLS